MKKHILLHGLFDSDWDHNLPNERHAVLKTGNKEVRPEAYLNNDN